MERVLIDEGSAWVNKPCFDCGKPMLPGHRAVVMPFIGNQDVPTLEPWHVNCVLANCGIERKVPNGGPDQPHESEQ